MLSVALFIAKPHGGARSRVPSPPKSDGHAERVKMTTPAEVKAPKPSSTGQASPQNREAPAPLEAVLTDGTTYTIERLEELHADLKQVKNEFDMRSKEGMDAEESAWGSSLQSSVWFLHDHLNQVWMDVDEEERRNILAFLGDHARALFSKCPLQTPRHQTWTRQVTPQLTPRPGSD